MKSHFLKKNFNRNQSTAQWKAGRKKKKSQNCSPHTARCGTYWNSPSRGKCSVNQWQRKCVIWSHIASFADDRRMQNCIKMQIKWHIWGRKWGRQTDPEVILMSHIAVLSRSDSEAANPAVSHHYCASLSLNAPPTSTCTNCRWYMTIKAVTRQGGFFHAINLTVIISFSNCTSRN